MYYCLACLQVVYGLNMQFDRARVGTIAFATDIVDRFYLNTYQNKEGVISALNFYNKVCLIFSKFLTCAKCKRIHYSIRANITNITRGKTQIYKIRKMEILRGVERSL